ncbi:hypothetical protein QUV50_09520 [Phascolarctobacterium faecium]|nr:hypothetical protein [Phascolarctobacterium faecium]MDM8112021.1 hypothetical protein [Phascolarctobacterium faecium]
MRKSLTYKILAAVMALSAVNVFVPHNMLAYYITSDNTTISPEEPIYENIYGNGHSFTITGGTIDGDVFGAGNDDENYSEDASGGNVTISGGSVGGYLGAVYGGRSNSGNAHHNTVNISGDSVTSYVYGGRSTDGSAHHNTVNISDGSVGGYLCAVYGGRSNSGNAHHNTVNISGGSVTGNVFGGNSHSREAHHNTVNISDGSVSSTVYGVYGGWSATGRAYDNTVNISGGSVSGYVYGGRSDNGKVYDNTVYISGGSVSGYVYGGRSTSGSAKDNQIIIRGSANIENANLYGSNKTNDTGNTLTIDGWSGKTNTVQNFNDIAFKNISWKNNGSILTITNQNGYTSDLTNTKIKTINIAGGSNINVGESMTLIKNNGTLNSIGNVTDTFTAGVAREGFGSTSVNTTTGGELSFKVNSIKLSSQAVSAAQTRAASAAFVNQGTDLISDSLDTISRDDNYGVKTFAAVHGNRSKYDVADDIKINGWSTIVGVGNADKFDNGSELSWGVFYENGSGNYRTYNSFNNEFFRGDGSMVYNGGGIAARYENKNGVYTEGSLRAGMLKNELDNAMRDVNGSYGYETESAYYGAHIGVGKIISLSDSSDLDIYGKFFHTYTEGDSVTIADDKFDFDSITSDRLRVGARITSNKENKFSTYYGLAYEYEFNGDADMTAQGLRADTQSLQGSSVMAEVGFNYQPTPDSPWSFDLNMRGYTGERQGGSFNVQATYTF